MKECWQFKIKKSKAAESEKIEINPSEAIIKEIDFKTASPFILEYEWLGNIGSAIFFYGLFASDRLAGVVGFGPPMSNDLYRRYLGSEYSGTILQLCRGASAPWAPTWVPSKLISASLRKLQHSKRCKAVVAYADPEAGEIGTIYQACNAIYFGKTCPGGAKIYFIKGRKYHPKEVYRIFGSRKKETLKKFDPKFTTQDIQPKHRYIFPVGGKAVRNEIMRKLKPYIEPYPKRVGSNNSAAS
jgi:hypothetical protein